jgi:hypothetical protein
MHVHTLQLELDMAYVYEMQEERMPMFLRKNDANGQFAVVFSVVRLDETVVSALELNILSIRYHCAKPTTVHIV